MERPIIRQFDDGDIAAMRLPSSNIARATKNDDLVLKDM